MAHKPFCQHVMAVLVSPQLQPSMVTRDILRDESMVSKDWIETEAPIQTPMFSQFQFKAGYKVISQPGKAILRQDLPQIEPFRSQVTTVAQQLSKLLPLQYDAAGLNFHVTVPTDDDPARRLLDSLVSDRGRAGKWPADTCALKLMYSIHGAKVSLSFDTGNYQFKRKNPQDESAPKEHGGPCYVVTVNFHYGLSGSVAERQRGVANAFSNVKNKWDEFDRQWREILEEGA